MKKVITKQMVNGVEVKIGDKVAVGNWLTFVYTITDMPRKNKFVCMSYHLDENGKEVVCGSPIVLTKGSKYWKENGHSKVYVEFNPDLKKVAAANDAVSNSETWMCM